MPAIAKFALALNCALLIVAWDHLFLQTHWESVSYVGLVLVVVGTPIINSISLMMMRRRLDGTFGAAPSDNS